MALGSIQVPMFQHLTGWNLIFPFCTHDGSKPVQVKSIFDPTAGLLPGFITSAEKSKNLSSYRLPFYGAAMVDGKPTMPVLTD